MTRKETLIYIAGIIDGEGYIGIKKHLSTLRSGGKGRGINPCYYERISVAGTNKDMIELLVKTFKVGKIYLHKPSKLSKRGYWSWDVTNRLAVSVIKQVFPYLLIKKPEAEVVMMLRESKKIRYGTLPKEVVERREELYQAIKTIHTFI